MDRKKLLNILIFLLSIFLYMFIVNYNVRIVILIINFIIYFKYKKTKKALISFGIFIVIFQLIILIDNITDYQYDISLRDEIRENYDYYEKEYITSDMEVDEYINQEKEKYEEFLNNNIGKSNTSGQKFINDLVSYMKKDPQNDLEGSLVDIINNVNNKDFIDILNIMEEGVGKLCMIINDSDFQEWGLYYVIYENLERIEEIFHHKHLFNVIDIRREREDNTYVTITYEFLDKKWDREIYTAKLDIGRQSIRSRIAKLRFEDYINKNHIMNKVSYKRKVAYVFDLERTVQTNYEINFITYLTIYYCIEGDVFSKEELNLLLSDELTEEQFKKFSYEEVYNPYPGGVLGRLSVIRSVKDNKVAVTPSEFANI